MYLTQGRLPMDCDICLQFLKASDFVMSECQLAMSKALLERQMKLEERDAYASNKASQASGSGDPPGFVKAESGSGDPPGVVKAEQHGDPISRKSSQGPLPKTVDAMLRLHHPDFSLLTPGWYDNKYMVHPCMCNLCNKPFDLKSLVAEGVSKLFRHTEADAAHLALVAKRRRLSRELSQERSRETVTYRTID